MTKWTLRLISGSMTTLAALTVLFVVLLAQKPVEAAACCQACEANEQACYNSCNVSTPEGELRNACYDDCYYQLYEWTYGCWRHCYYCGGGGGGETIACYTCTTTWYFDQYGHPTYGGTECGAIDHDTGFPAACSIW